MERVKCLLTAPKLKKGKKLYHRKKLPRAFSRGLFKVGYWFQSISEIDEVYFSVFATFRLATSSAISTSIFMSSPRALITE